MSLFERLNNKRYNLQEGIDSKGNVTPNPGDAAKEKSILRNYNKQQKNLSKEIGQRVTAQNRQQQLYNRQYDAYDDGDLGNPNQLKTKVTKKVTAASGAKVEFPSGSAEMGGESKKFASRNRTPSPVVTATSGGKTKSLKPKGVNQADVSKQAKEFTKKINKQNKNLNPTTRANYPKTRPELIAKRAEYGIDRKGNISDAGVKRYALKTKQLSSGSNIPAKVTAKDLKVAKLRAVGGEKIKDSTGKVVGTTTGKYGGRLPNVRGKNQPSLADVKAKIDAKNPTYTSPITGGKLPLSNLDKYDSPVAKFNKMLEKGKKIDPEGTRKALLNMPDDPRVSKNEPLKFSRKPRRVYVKTPPSKAFPLGLKSVDTQTKEGEKIAKRVTKKFVTDKELTTGIPPETKRVKPNLFNRAKRALKGFHKFMIKDAGYRKTSGSGRLMKDTLGGIARDKNITRNIYKNTIRGNTFRAINKALPGKYKALAALTVGGYLATRGKGKQKDNGGGAAIVGTKKNPEVYDSVTIRTGFDTGN